MVNDQKSDKNKTIEGESDLVADKFVTKLISDARSFDMSPSVDLSHRITSRLSLDAEQSKPQINLSWAAVFVLFFSTGVLYFSSNTRNGSATMMAVIHKSYVIQVDTGLDQTQADDVAEAEIILPEGVHFVADSEELASLHQLRLAVKVRGGTEKLPFIVASETEGEKSIVLKFLNKKSELVKVKNLNFKFAKSDSVNRTVESL